MSNFCNISLKKKKYTKLDGKTLSNLGNHLLRQQKEDYNLADGTHEENNEVLISMSEPTLKRSLDKYIKDNNLKVRNSRSVLACQFVLSIPKELKNDKKKIEEFKKQSLEFLNTNDKFKGNVLLAVYHGDEIQPHIQIVIVPNQNGKLCFQEMFGGFPQGAEKLSNLQDEFASFMKPLGLIRGDGTHTNGLSHQEYKQVIRATESRIEPIPSIPEVEPSWNPYKKIDGQQSRIDALEKQVKVYKNAYKKTVFLEKQNEVLKSTNVELKIRRRKAEDKIMRIEETNLDKLRQISCFDVMEKLGYNHKKGDKSKFVSDSFNIGISQTTNKFYDNTSGKGGYGAIDLLKTVFNYTFKQAVDFLSDNFGYDRTAEVLSTNEKATKAILTNAVKASKTELPKPIPKNLSNIKKYLIEKRKIKEEIVNELIDKNLIYADSRNNCVFLNEEKTFAFSRGTYGEKNDFKMCNGEMDFIKYDFDKQKTNEIYMFESTIDALSFRTLNPSKDGLYVVLNGSTMINHIEELKLDSFSKVNLCFDADEQGTKFCDIVKNATVSQVEIHKPTGKDFNEDLKNVELYKLTENLNRRNQQNSATVNRETKSTEPDTAKGNYPTRRKFR